MNTRLAVLADYANVSQEGKLNIMGVFGEVNPPVLPFPLPTMYLVLVFQAEPSEVSQRKALKVVLLDSEGKELLAVEQTVVVPDPKRPGSWVELTAVLCFNLVRFERADSYAFHVLVGGDSKAVVPLRVNEPPKEEGAR